MFVPRKINEIFQTMFFSQQYRVFGFDLLPGDRSSLNYGGKIILPHSALMRLQNFFGSAMFFKIESNQLSTYAGVLEFIAEEGRVYLPNWMFKQFNIQQGHIVRVTMEDLPKGKFVKLKPQSVDFLDISDPKAVLENAFRHYSCLTTNDIVEFEYNRKSYAIKITESNPSQAISILETDLEVDFEAPEGYVEPKKEVKLPHHAHFNTHATLLNSHPEILDKMLNSGNKIKEREQKPTKWSAELLEKAQQQKLALDLPLTSIFTGYIINRSEEDKSLDHTFKGNGYRLK
eukprot:NODE_102_length_19640_cov_1.308735.p10 type:complete len:288 gc:universal NODE_102_length_19640_cov_1.308735:13516-14379(+)